MRRRTLHLQACVEEEEDFKTDACRENNLEEEENMERGTGEENEQQEKNGSHYGRRTGPLEKRKDCWSLRPSSLQTHSVGLSTPRARKH